MSTDLRVVDNNQYLTDPQKFEHLWRVAKAFSICGLVPEAIRGKPEDCFVLTQLAIRLQVDPFMLFQNMYVVHGRPGMEAKLQIGLLNASGRIKGNICYTFSGDGDEYGCTASVIDAASGQKIEGPKVTWRMVKAEKWNEDKKSKSGYVQVSKWKAMPEVMFRYRAAAMLIRAHYPEVTLGLMTREELEEQVIDVESTMAQPAALPATGTKSEALAAAIARPTEEPEKKTRKRKEKAVEPEQAPEPESEQQAETADGETAEDNAAISWCEAIIARLMKASNVLQFSEIRDEVYAHPARDELPQEALDRLSAALTEAEKRCSE